MAASTKFTIEMKSAPEFALKWVIDGIANSTFNGMKNSRLQAAEFLAEARKILDGANANDEIAQTKLNRLADRVAEREEQADYFTAVHKNAVVAFENLTGTPWKPFAAKVDTKARSKTATNKFFSDRLQKTGGHVIGKEKQV